MTKTKTKTPKAGKPVTGYFRTTPANQSYISLVAGPDTVTLSQVLEYDEETPRVDVLASLPRARWELVRQGVEYVLNQQIEEGNGWLCNGHSYPPCPYGRFAPTGETRLAIENLGREVAVLCWALEQCSDGQEAGIWEAWRAMHPVERWWVWGRGLGAQPRSGWRTAVYHGLSGT